MNKAIFFKEWIKTRLFHYPAGIALFRRIRRDAHQPGHHFQGGRPPVGHHPLPGIPCLSSTNPAVIWIFASSQFIPEMTQKRLKLTLHLPYPQQRMILLMLLAGVAQISIVFLLQAASLWIYLQQHIACEMVARILLTAAPWYICGYTAYLMTAWICLEPTWKLRIVNLLIAAGIVRIFFLLDKPVAYNSFLPTLIIFTILCASLSIRSICPIQRRLPRHFQKRYATYEDSAKYFST